MKNTIIRLQEVEIESFKNVGKGKITVPGYNNLKRNGNVENEKSNMIGIYGQNGSGKTAMIDSLALLKNILSGNTIPKEIVNLISRDKDNAQFKFTFLIEHLEEKFLVYYDFTLTKDQTNNVARLSKEVLSCMDLNKKGKKIKIIDYQIENTTVLFKPKTRFNELMESNKDNLVNLNVAKALAKKQNTSFIFSEESVEIFKEGFKSNLEYGNIIKSLRYFAIVNLFVIDNTHQGIINMSDFIPFAFRFEDNGNVVAGSCIALFNKSNIDEKALALLIKIKEQINIVIKTIIPGLSIDIEEYGKELEQTGELKTTIELVSVRDNKRIPLKYESEGIKKIISILSALISMYNNRSICLAIDELDAGIFEYLLGEILSIIEESGKGQFIFTLHNLRPLEKLNKESIIFTTNNFNNRYIRLGNIKSNNNLRDFYLRGIALGGQREELYEATNTFEINYAFRKAGKISYEE